MGILYPVNQCGGSVRSTRRRNLYQTMPRPELFLKLLRAIEPGEVVFTADKSTLNPLCREACLRGMAMQTGGVRGFLATACG